MKKLIKPGVLLGFIALKAHEKQEIKNFFYIRVRVRATKNLYCFYRFYVL